MVSLKRSLMSNLTCTNAGEPGACSHAQCRPAQRLPGARPGALGRAAPVLTGRRPRAYDSARPEPGVCEANEPHLACVRAALGPPGCGLPPSAGTTL